MFLLFTDFQKMLCLAQTAVFSFRLKVIKRTMCFHNHVLSSVCC